MASVLTERFNVGTMTYMAESKESASPFLAYFEGPAADYKHPTRNSRMYPLELWTRVIESEDFKEAMSTRTCLGELNHPFDDSRLDIDLREVAIVLLSLDIHEDGIVWAKFGILDTPNGRLLKTLLDSGCQIGVSSRGSGDISEDPEDGPMVEADTYYFVCFDAVVTPAVVAARPSMHESYDPTATEHTTLTETLSTQISNAKSTNELSTIQSIVESLNLPEMDAIKASIDIKSSELQNGENISSGLMTDLEESLKANESLTNELNELKKAKSADDIRIKRLESLIEKFRSGSKGLRANLLTANSHINEMSEALVDGAAQCDDLSDQLSNLNEKYEVVVTDRDKLLEKVKHMRSMNLNASEIQHDLDECRSKLNESYIRIRDLVAKNESLHTKNKELTEKLDTNASQYSDAKLLTESMRNKYSSTMKSYIHLQASKSGLSESLIIGKLPKNYACSDVDKVVANLLSYNDRMAKMPIAMNEGLNHVVSMHVDTPATDEDMDTMSVLANFNKK